MDIQINDHIFTKKTTLAAQRVFSAACRHGF